MKCIYDPVLLSRYLEKELTAKKMKRISDHLEKCDACRKECERLRTAMVIMKSVQVVPAPKNYAEVMQRKLSQDKQ